ncbi:MAG: putative toxin-antitoxin system toxin component, PIN family [Devosia sp.]
MIVLDVSTLVSVAIREDSTPDRAFRHALRTDRVAVSEPVLLELLDVLHRPGLARFVRPALRTALLNQLYALAIRFTPTVSVTDCRDAKDNKYLELALTADAATIVSSDNDLLVLHPWRGVRILLPAAYLAEAQEPA